MNNSGSGGCLLFTLISILIGAGLGVLFVTQNATDPPTGAPMRPTEAPTEICTANVTEASAESPPFAYKVEIEYRGEPLENVRFEIDSPYTQMYLAINGTRYQIAGPSMMMSEPINFTNADTLVLYYDGAEGRAAETLTLTTDTTTVNCAILP